MLDKYLDEHDGLLKTHLRVPGDTAMVRLGLFKYRLKFNNRLDKAETLECAVIRRGAEMFEHNGGSRRSVQENSALAALKNCSDRIGGDDVGLLENAPDFLESLRKGCKLLLYVGTVCRRL